MQKVFHHLFWFITKSCAIVDLLTYAQVRTQRFKDSILLVFYYLFRHNSGILPLTHAPSIKFFFHFIYSCYWNKLHLYKYIYDIKVLLLQFERKKIDFIFWNDHKINNEVQFQSNFSNNYIYCSSIYCSSIYCLRIFAILEYSFIYYLSKS